jgi:hypothetical protein
MKNLRVVFAAIPFLLLTIFIYFSINGFSSHANTGSTKLKDPGLTIKDKPSIIYPVHLTNTTGGGCLSGDYTYCIDGGKPQTATGDFEVDLACGQYHTICVNSSTGCYGTWTGWIDCFATFPQIDIDLATTPPVECFCN